MDFIILFEFPASNGNARSWILDRVALLAIEGHADIEFVASGRPTSCRSATETIAVRIAGIELANAILAKWQRDVPFPGQIEMRSLRIESFNFAAPLFPCRTHRREIRWRAKLGIGPTRTSRSEHGMSALH